MFQRAQQLIDVASQHQKAELVTLHNAVLERMEAYKKASTAANKRDWAAAKKGLQECIDQLLPVYFPELSAADPEVFDTQKAALAWLHNHFGKPYPSAGKFSQDIRDGLCLQQQNKTILRKDLKKYAEVIGHDKQAAAASASQAEKREKLEIEKLELDVEKRRMENRKEDKNWIARDTVFEREGALVGQIMGEARHHLGRAVPAVIHAAKGDPERTPEIKKIIEEALFDAFRSLYESGEVDMTFLQEEED
ncbi:MAG: hypothetical protein AB7D06_08845 [Pedobacter sp.]